MAHDNSCYYNCSQRPSELTSIPDISGVGVLIGYTATAAIVVLILVFHYHLAHDPTKDPFHKEDVSASLNPRPNPVDVVYLSLSSRAIARLRPRRKLPKVTTYPRLEAVFIKCVQSMSDLQILTGTSILISGFAQLRCGISTFHWQIIVLLAWFSSITHLSCLTFLRNHLYNRPAERAWRLITMGLMMLMLIIALVPTGTFLWTDAYYHLYGRFDDDWVAIKPSDYAICYLLPTRPEIAYEPKRFLNTDVAVFWTMVLSAVSLTLGFIHRVIRLHRSLSVSVVGRVRTTCSQNARGVLRLVYTKMNLETSGLTFKRMFIYRPLLALFLTARAMLDFWNSMFIEILWMVGSFCWGLIRLLSTLSLEDRGSSDWSFGQVVPIVLLAAPLLVVFESFFKAQQPSNLLSTGLLQVHTAYSQSDHSNPSPIPPLHERDHPDHDFYQDSSWTRSLIYLMVSCTISTATLVLSLVNEYIQHDLIGFLVPTSDILAYLPVYMTLAIWLFIMLSILIEDISYAQQSVSGSLVGMTGKTFSRSCKVFLFILNLGGILAALIMMYQLVNICLLGTSVVMYCVLSIMVHCITVRHEKVFL